MTMKLHFLGRRGVRRATRDDRRRASGADLRGLRRCRSHSRMASTAPGDHGPGRAGRRAGRLGDPGRAGRAAAADGPPLGRHGRRFVTTPAGAAARHRAPHSADGVNRSCTSTGESGRLARHRTRPPAYLSCLFGPGRGWADHPPPGTTADGCPRGGHLAARLSRSCEPAFCAGSVPGDPPNPAPTQ